MAAVAVLVFFALLAFCGVGFYFSCRLMFRGFRGLVGEMRPAVVAPKTVHETARPGVPGWVLSVIRHHLDHCPTCAAAVAEYTAPNESLAEMLDRMEPATITRMVHIVETEDKVVTP